MDNEITNQPVAEQPDMIQEFHALQGKIDRIERYIIAQESKLQKAEEFGFVNKKLPYEPKVSKYEAAEILCVSPRQLQRIRVRMKLKWRKVGKNVYGGNYTDGDKFDGLTRKVGFDRMIPPHALEVCYNKTTHIIFPSEIVYCDLGNENLVAGLADGAKNVLRVKSAFKSFKQETNLSVITEDGSYYTFNVKFAKEPLLLSIEMTDFLHDGEAVNRPNNAQEIYLEKLGSESPMLVKLIMYGAQNEACNGV